MEPNNVFSPPRQSTQTEPQSQSQRMKSDTCFKCHRKGHWAKDCSLRSPGASPSKFTPSGDMPTLHCGCGAACVVRTSTTPKNPSRSFYICLQCSKRKKSSFGGWCDEFDDVPDCPCGLGKCRIYTASEFDNRKYYGCRIKRGFGGCDFRKFVNDQRAIMTVDQSQMMETEPPAAAEPSMIDIDADIDELFLSTVSETPAAAEPSMIDIDADIDKLFLSNDFDETVLSIIASKQNSSGESQAMVIEEGSGSPGPDFTLEDSTTKDIVALDQISQRPQESDIRRMQEDFTRQILAVGDGLTEDTFKLFLGRQVMGWCGRIAFRPSRMLTEPPAKPFFCCIFPSFSAIESNVTGVIDKQGRSPVYDGPMSPGPEKMSCGSEQVMQLLTCLAHLVNSTAPNQLPRFRTRGRYTELLQRTATDVQNQFIALLDNVNPLDIDRLRNEAVVCFTTLGLLRDLDCREFICRVMNYIECASAFVKIQRSVNSDPSLRLQQLSALHNAKQKYREDLSRLHMEKSNVFSASEERCRMLEQNAAQYREMLRQTESDIAQCKADLAKQERSLVEVNQEVKKSRKSMEAVAREVVEAQHKEMERAAAEDALLKARASFGH